MFKLIGKKTRSIADKLKEISLEMVNAKALYFISQEVQK